MNHLRTLILTDHGGHSEQNSVYSLARALAADARSSLTCIASRGLAKNHVFFKGDGAQVHGIEVNRQFGFDPAGRQFSEQAKLLNVTDFDLIWLRLPHPFPPGFAAKLDRYHELGIQVVNRPAGILETGDKAYLLNWRQFSPPMALVHSGGEVSTFANDHKCVLKPLRAYGGKGIVRVENGMVRDGSKQYSIADWWAATPREPMLAVQFLENVSKGDKRILVVNGRTLGASLRMPAPGGWLCNVAQGGRSLPATVTAEEEAMVAAISPELLRHGVAFYGMDTLEDDAGKRVLSELNTLSIGGFPQAEAQSGNPVVQWAIDELFNYIRTNPGR